MKYKQLLSTVGRQAKVWLLLAIYLVSFTTTGLLTAQTAHAATATGEWLDRATIIVDGVAFRDSNDLDNTHDFLSTTCKGEITLSHDSFLKGGGTADYYQQVLNSYSSCVWTHNGDKDKSKTTITLSGTDKRYVTAYQLDADTIFLPSYFTRSCNKSGTCHDDSHEDGVFIRLHTDAQACTGRPLGTSGIDKGRCTIFWGAGDIGNKAWVDTSVTKVFADCLCGDSINVPGFASDSTKDSTPIAFANSRSFTQPNAATGYNTSVSADSSSSSSAATCESNNSTVVIGWLVCSFIGAIDGAVNVATDAVNSLLSVSGENFSTGANGTALHTAWSLFRSLASFSLLAVALIMIISQAMGGE